MQIVDDVFECDIEFVDFIFLYRISKISDNKVLFKKYRTKRFESENDCKELIRLENEIGDELYEVSPEVNLQLVGRVGDLIKSYEGEIIGEKNKRFIITKINNIIY